MTNSKNDLLGDWQATKDIRTIMGGAAFTIPKGAIVAVVQIDNTFNKVLIEAGPRMVDWKHPTFLQSFEVVA